MKNLITLSILVFCLSFYTSAQSSSPVKRPDIITRLQQQDNSQGRVQIFEDKRIEDLLSKNIEKNARKGTFIRGYRILIFSKNSQDAQEKAMIAKSKFLNKFPEIETYPIVEAPFWKVYIGDFRTITDALRMQKQIEELFPNAFWVEADINYNKL
jgi:hypothetical protein